MKKVELLAPAGDAEKLRMAFAYGADAVYLGGRYYGLRAGAGNFTVEEMQRETAYAHSIGKRVYVTLNILPHNRDLDGMKEYIRCIVQAGIDGIIVSDPGVFSLARTVSEHISIHISTQANNTNWKSAFFWYELGAKRVILARELTLEEIRQIRNKVPDDLQLEVFVHGSMCISYSGRCLLSSYMAERDPNLGLCAHPCRWKYHLMEEKRPGQYYPVYEDGSGTFIMNSKDLCMIQHISELVNSGVSSLKIEGRMKSTYYVALVVKAYRTALDSYYEDPQGYVFNPGLLEEVSKASHREFTTGFFFGGKSEKKQMYNTSSYIRDYDFVAVARGYEPSTGYTILEQRNRIKTGDEVEVVPPAGDYFTCIIREMYNEDMASIGEAPHPQMKLYVPLGREVPANTVLRRRKV